MFKKHIKKWGLDNKHLKSGELLIAALGKRRRDAVHKSSKIIIRGKKVPWEEIQRHLSRNPKLQAKLESADTNLEMVGHDNRDVVVRTPSPDLGHTVRISRSLNADDDLHLTEELGRIVRNYVIGSLDKGAWIFEDGDLYTTLPGSTYCFIGDGELTQVAETAFDLLKSGDSQSGFLMIKRFLDIAIDLLPIESPSLLQDLCTSLFYGNNLDPTFERQYLPIILCHLAELCEVTLGHGHPLSLFWSRLRRKNARECLDAAIFVFRPIVSCFAERFGTSSIPVVEAEQMLLSWQDDTLDPDVYFRECQKSLSKLQVIDLARCIHIKLELADSLVEVGLLNDAEAILREVADMAPTQDPDKDLHLFWAFHDSLWRVQFAAGRFIDARETSYRLVKECSTRYGELNSRTLRFLRYYRSSLERLGDFGEAGKITDGIGKPGWMTQYLESRRDSHLYRDE